MKKSRKGTKRKGYGSTRKKSYNKTRRHTKGTAKRYIPGRVQAIQRATFMPQTRVIEFVMDETFYLVANSVQKAANSFGLVINMSAPYAPFGTRGGGGTTVPFWGAADFGKCARLSGKTADFATYSCEGLGRWVGFSPSPYRKGTVIGFDTEIRAEQATQSVTRVSPAPVGERVRSIALCAKISKSTGQVDGTCTGSANLNNWQNKRKVRQVNMTTALGNDTYPLSGPVKNTAHQAFIHMRGSPKKIHGISQYKDNDKMSFEYDDVTSSTAQFIPTDDPTYLHIGVFDRFAHINNTTDGENQAGQNAYIMPDMVIRTKTKFICLLSEPNNNANVDMGGAVGMDLATGGD